MTVEKKTLEKLQRWIRSAGTGHEEPAPPQRDADNALRAVLEENERLEKNKEFQRGMCDRREAEFKAETDHLKAENERLRDEVAWLEERNAMNVKTYQDRIDAALAIPGRERLKNEPLETDYAEVVGLMVRAIKGEEE